MVSAVVSSLGIVPTPNRGREQSGEEWLKARSGTDGAEGLWRVHDGIYDLTTFADTHPGGSDWIKLTRGTDITEAFEVHHLSKAPAEILKKFFVQQATQKRNTPFTFKDNGFYMTLKREVIKKLPPSRPKGYARSALLTDLLLMGTFIASVLSARFQSYLLGVTAGLLLGLLTVAAHNFFHQKDNFRMYYFNFSLYNYRDWRITHALSHHLYTNTVNDLEITLVEPFHQYLPVDKTFLVKYGAWVYFPIFWSCLLHLSLVNRIIAKVKYHKDSLRVDDLISMALPLAMILTSGQSILSTLFFCNLIIAVGSLYAHGIGLTAGHHHPDVFHDGDKARTKRDYDWGLNQLDCVIERRESQSCHFIVLTSFGDHTLHHLFPTLDHEQLAILYPTLESVCKKFNVQVRVASQWETFKGCLQQMAKTVPNPQPPNLFKKY